MSIQVHYILVEGRKRKTERNKRREENKREQNRTEEIKYELKAQLLFISIFLIQLVPFQELPQRISVFHHSCYLPLLLIGFKKKNVVR